MKVNEDSLLYLFLAFAIEEAGGTFQGIQKGYPEHGIDDLVLFSGPSGSTMCLPLLKVSTPAIKYAIAEKELKFIVSRLRHAAEVRS